MSVTFQKSENINTIREPLFQINRVKFKSERLSLLENLETNLLKIDLTRILNELDNIDTTILIKLNYFIPPITDYNEQNKLNDGISYVLDGINLYIDDDSATEQEVEIQTTNKLSGKLSRLFYKLSLLETGN